MYGSQQSLVIRQKPGFWASARSPK